MQDTFTISRKLKIQLSDYDYISDVRQRLLLKALSQDEVEILEEILFSPLQFTVDYLAKNLNTSPKELFPILEKLSLLGLFSIQNNSIQIDKEKRKYFELQLERFSSDFRPDMEFLQNLLRSLPIHILPSWYHIPRSSNNIFSSLLEKYLQTPQIYQRHLFDTLSEETLLSQIGRDVIQSGSVETEELLSRYTLSREELEEIIITLEYQLIAYSSFKEDEDGWKCILTPLTEWQEYKSSLKDMECISSEEASSISLYRPQEFAFIEDMTSLLELTLKDRTLTPQKAASLLSLEEVYVEKLLNKLKLLGLLAIEEGKLKSTSYAIDWIEIELVKRAHITFKHPHNFLVIQKASPLATKRTLLEIEKSLSLVPHNKWVYFADFLAHCKIALSEEKKISLKKNGRFWQYALPEYDREEKEFIRITILDWFFESGIVHVGTLHSKPCFCLTKLGRSLSS